MSQEEMILILRLLKGIFRKNHVTKKKVGKCSIQTIQAYRLRALKKNGWRGKSE
jgi:hypothetical protein